MTQRQTSDTARGQAWLGNFDPKDRSDAAELLNHIRFARISEMRSALKDSLEDFLDRSNFDRPSLLLPVQAKEDLHVEGDDAKDDDLLVAFENFSLDQPISSTPGSEGWVGTLVRDVLKSAAGKKSALPPSTDLERVRQKKVGRIVLVTDYIGSGQQVQDFAKVLTRNRTIRSWRSGNILDLEVFSFAAPLATLDGLRAQGSPVDRVHTIEIAPAIANFGYSKRMRFTRLCKKYAAQRSNPLGYRGSGGLFASDASVPNNLPAILRQTKSRQKGESWTPFFEGRHASSVLASELEGCDSANIRHASPRERSVNGERVFKVLDVLSRRPLTVEEIALLTKQSVRSAETLISGLLSLGLVRDSGGACELTKAGTVEIESFQHQRRITTAGLHGSDGFYYPRALR